MTPSLCAYVPCFNNAATLRQAVESVRAQTCLPAEIIVVDDGSTDGSAEQVRDLPGVRIVRHEMNLGRGAARARAMRETTRDLVLCCDATNVLDREFAAKALRWFDEPQVAGVFGVFRQSIQDTAALRWRGRHLFKLDVPRQPQRDMLLATSGAVVRRSAVRDAGGFDAALRHSEDADIGARLLACGYTVVCDSEIGFVSVSRNTVAEVLERYWRWYAGKDEVVTWRGYWKNFIYAAKYMAIADLRARDPLSAGISLVCPHYQAWKSWRRK